jgi:hypothetical protein
LAKFSRSLFFQATVTRLLSNLLSYHFEHNVIEDEDPTRSRDSLSQTPVAGHPEAPRRLAPHLVAKSTAARLNNKAGTSEPAQNGLQSLPFFAMNAKIMLCSELLAKLACIFDVRFSSASSDFST